MTGSQTSDVGTTAEIFSVKEEEEYGVLNLIMKAEGRQRFRVLDVKRQIDGYRYSRKISHRNSRNIFASYKNSLFHLKIMRKTIYPKKCFLNKID